MPPTPGPPQPHSDPLPPTEGEGTRQEARGLPGAAWKHAANVVATSVRTARPAEPPELPLARAMFTRAGLAWIWLAVRVYVGWQWLTSGHGKIVDPAWVGDGSALLAFWRRAVAVPAPPAMPPIAYDWYRAFLQALIDCHCQGWFAKLIAFGELLVGLGLIVGVLVGVTACFGALLNMNYMLAGSASTNPVLFLLAVLLMLAWRTAGHLGLDYLVLPALASRRRPPGRAAAAAPPSPDLTARPEAASGSEAA